MGNIYTKSKIGFKWTFFSNIIKGGFGFLTLLILTYVLGPERMGIISILMVIYGLSETFVQFGISQSIIAREKNTNSELSSIFWTNFGVGVLFFVLINFFSGVIANFYNQSELQFYIQALSFIFLIEPLDLIFRAILEKEFRFPTLEKVNILRSLTFGVFTILLVLLGFDVFGYVIALILSILISTVVFTFIFIKEKLWFPSLHFSLGEIKTHYSFGFYVTAKEFINYVGRNFDELIVGKFLGIEVLGIYYFAKKVVEKPIGLFSSSLSKVTFPFYAKLKNDIPRLKKAYLNLTHIVANLGLLFSGLVIVVVPYLLPLFWSMKWFDAIILIQLFSIIVFFDLISRAFGSVALYAFNKPKILFQVDLFLTPVRLFLIFLASLVSINLVAIVFLGTVIFKMLTIQCLTNKYLFINFKDYLSEFVIPMQNTIISAIVVFLIWFFSPPINNFIMLFLMGIVFVLCYTIIGFYRDSKLIKNILRELDMLKNNK
jgi:O-antigen/teichoic acid export membrane protein